jgi:CubicO group peptidase (beta-lactamase class C family)
MAGLSRAQSRGLSGAALLLALVAMPAALAQRAGVDLARLESYVRESQVAWDIPGLAVAIVKDDRVVLARGYGVREMGKPEPVDEHTLFAIASNTKAFTAAALARLSGEQKVGWDDRVVDRLPYFRLYDDYVTADMRIRDLLSHRSGLRTFSGDLVWYGTSYTREEVIRRARHLTPEGPFRSHYGYSNIMFIAAGEIVGRLSGRSWDDYVKQEFFDPLGMRRTVTSVAALRGRDNVATPHGGFDVPQRPFPWVSWDNAGPAAGIISSAADMAQWVRLQLGRGTLGSRTYFSEAASNVMWTPQISFTVSPPYAARVPGTHFRGYGLGWSVRDYGGRLIVSHGGAADGMFSNVTLVPEERLGVVVLTNSDNGLADALPNRIVDAYLGADDRDWSAEALERRRQRNRDRAAAREAKAQARRSGTKPSLPLDAYAGSYPSDLYGDAQVTVENGRLVLRLVPNPALVADLTHWHLDTFALQWRQPFPWFGGGHVQFILDQDARVTELTLDVPNDDFWFWEPRFFRVKN